MGGGGEGFGDQHDHLTTTWVKFCLKKTMVVIVVNGRFFATILLNNKNIFGDQKPQILLALTHTLSFLAFIHND